MYTDTTAVLRLAPPRRRRRTASTYAYADRGGNTHVGLLIYFPDLLPQPLWLMSVDKPWNGKARRQIGFAETMTFMALSNDPPRTLRLFVIVKTDGQAK